MCLFIYKIYVIDIVGTLKEENPERAIHIEFPCIIIELIFFFSLNISKSGLIKNKCLLKKKNHNGSSIMSWITIELIKAA